MSTTRVGGPLKGRIGEILLRQGVVSEAELTTGLMHQHGTNKLLGEVLINLQLATPRDIDLALCQQNSQYCA